MQNTLSLLLLFSLTLLSPPAMTKENKVNPFQRERIAPLHFNKTDDGTYFADFGKDAFGTLELNYHATHPETLSISLGEKLLEGKIDPKPGGTIRYQEVRLNVTPAQQTYRLQLTADKRNTSGDAVLLPDTFGVITPFRYVEIRKASQTIQSSDLHQLAYFYRFDENQSSFTSSDTILNQVWELCKYTMKATSFAGVYIDGDRERIPYEADAYINQLGHYCVDKEYTLAQNSIHHFMRHPTWPTEWLLHTVLMCYQDYLYSGSSELLEKYYQTLKDKTLIALAREDGLISTTTGKVNGAFMGKIGFADTTKRVKDIVDWPPGQKDTGWKLVNAAGERDGYEMVAVNTVVNCFFFENMRLMAEIAGVLNHPSDRAYFEKMADKVKTAINQKLFDSAKGIYLDGEGASHSSLHANMMALAFGIVPDKWLPTVTGFVKSRGMACSVYGAQFLMEGLYRVGDSAYALDLMRSTGDRSWWNMIRSGATIAMEAWDMKYKPNSDWNHAWGAVPANIIPRYLWGIQPGKPGYTTVKIHPQLGDLKFTTLKVPTRLGQIKAEYRQVDAHRRTYLLELPPRMTGEFFPTTRDGETITCNNKKYKSLNQSIRLKPGINHIEINFIGH